MDILNVIFACMVLMTVIQSMPIPSNDIADIYEKTSTNCADCGAGTCLYVNPNSPPMCICMKPYISTSQRPCSRKGKSKLASFLISFLVGSLGVDWFYLSGGDAGYIVAGIFKLLTCGGFGIWYLVDWIRILTDSFLDGQGMELFQDM